jgi:hypothetical protein
MENMDNELDVVVFVDDEGNEVTMEVVDYFFYEGQEYAVLCEYSEDAEESEEPREAYVMKVVPVGEDEDEFIPVDEALAAKLIEILENEEFDEDEDEE